MFIHTFIYIIDFFYRVKYYFKKLYYILLKLYNIDMKIKINYLAIVSPLIKILKMIEPLIYGVSKK